MSNSRQRVLDDIKTALKSGDKSRLAVLRLLSAAIKQKEVDDRIELDEPQTIAILDKAQKQRRESIEQYSKAGRDDLVEQEQFEIGIIQEYLPQPLDEAEITTIVEAAIASTGAESVKDMGKIMGLIKPELQGRADMSKVSQEIRSKLGA